jgi:UDP-galactopyranose mutase
MSFASAVVCMWVYFVIPMLVVPRNPGRYIPNGSWDVCIVGAGLSGTVMAERYATMLNQTSLVMDSRHHIGGNCFDERDATTGILVNLYGPHLFHTNIDRVWAYINSPRWAAKSPWVRWEHRVLGVVDGKEVPIPVNIATVNSLMGLNISSEVEMVRWLESVQVSCNGTCRNAKDMAISRVGPLLYEKIFRHYTLKQWAIEPIDLDAEVTARIPVTSSFDDRYFKDTHQALPLHGYTDWFRTVLDNPYIQVVLGVDYFRVRDLLRGRCGKLIYTGPIDRYFVSSGMEKLAYRSLRFKKRVIPDIAYGFHQHAGQVNYPGGEVPYTRITEYKHMLNQSSIGTVLVEEYSTADGDPYYPIPTQRNRALYQRYQSLAANESGVYFVGRLANYKYMNMDVAIDNALRSFTEIEGVQHADIETPAPPAGCVTAGSGWCLPENCSALEIWDVLPLAQVTETAGHCKHVFLSAAIFPVVRSGRTASAFDLSPPLYSGPVRCGILFASDNLQGGELQVKAESHGWTIIFLNITGRDSSGEAQRVAHMIKVLAPVIFHWARFVSYGDIKCQKRGRFPDAQYVSWAKLMREDVHLVVNQHPQDWNKTGRLGYEFDMTRSHMRNRGEGADVFLDIDRLEKRYRELGWFDQHVNMPDTCCMHYRVNEITKGFACTWAHDVWRYSMREQLSFNVALHQTSLKPISGQAMHDTACHRDRGGVWYAPSMSTVC